VPAGSGGSRRRGHEIGLVLPSWVALVSLAAVAAAMLAFFVTGSPDDAEPAAPVALPSEPTNDTEPRKEPKPPAKPKPDPERERPDGRGGQADPVVPEAYVEVYNNSTVSGLAAQTAGELQDAGWNVVGTDNWYGSIPESTVYYPQRLREQAMLLARDLGVDRIRPAVSPMRFDRLTVILTASA